MGDFRLEPLYPLARPTQSGSGDTLSLDLSADSGRSWTCPQCWARFNAYGPCQIESLKELTDQHECERKTQ